MSVNALAKSKIEMTTLIHEKKICLQVLVIGFVKVIMKSFDIGLMINALKVNFELF